ncbi:MAG: TAXI family TRAP transporter solute-binding subunit [Microcoleaceae cyanobacterium]
MQNRFLLAILSLGIFGAGLLGLLLFFRGNHQVYSLTLATASKSGQYYAFGQTLSETVAKQNPRIQLKVIETEGSRQNVELLNQDEAQMALIQSDTPISLSIQSVAFLFPEIFHLIATRESNIQTVSDLKGKKIAVMPEGSGSNQLFQQLSQHYGFADTDFEVQPLASKQAHLALEAGQVDALFQVITLGNPGISRLLRSGKNRLVPIDQAAALQLFQPALETSQIPKGTYSGSLPIPETDLSTVSVRAVLVTRRDVPEKVIHEITQVLFEARSELVALNPQAALIKQPESPRELGFSFHPGAKRYYTQDEPSFLERYAEPIGLIISASVLVFSGLWQLKLWLQSQQKNRADLYNLEILNLIDQVQDAHSAEALQKVRDKLLTIFKEVIQDLDRDRISAESFQSFTFTWQAAIASIRHRENLLKSST